MTHPSKRKGNGFEREIVQAAQARGLVAQRAYASNGEALGEHATVDVLIEGQRLQAKRRAVVAQWLYPTEHTDAVVVRENRGEALVVMKLDDWLTLVKAADIGWGQLVDRRQDKSIPFLGEVT